MGKIGAYPREGVTTIGVGEHGDYRWRERRMLLPRGARFSSVGERLSALTSRSGSMVAIQVGGEVFADALAGSLDGAWGRRINPHREEPSANVLLTLFRRQVSRGIEWCIMKSPMTVLAIWSACCSLAVASVINVPGDYATIQEAIDAAQDGDTVLVAPVPLPPVDYITFRGKAIVVTSSDGPARTIIQSSGNWCDALVRFDSGEGPSSVLEGFTIQGIYDDGSYTHCYDMPGIYCSGSSPTIQNNIIQGHLSGGGGGIRCIGGFPIIMNNVIRRNIASNGSSLYPAGYGAGIYCSDASPTIVNNVIVHNRTSGNPATGYYGGAGVASVRSNLVLRGNVICWNAIGGFNSFGTGVYVDYGTALLENNTIGWNSTFGANVYGRYLDAPAIIDQCIIWIPSDWQSGYELDIDALLSYSDVNTFGGQPPPGIGNISADPEVVDPFQDDFSLLLSSPCVDAGNPADKTFDRDLTGGPRRLDGDLAGGCIVDMGAIELGHVRLKATSKASPGGSITIVTNVDFRTLKAAQQKLHGRGMTTTATGASVILFVGTSVGDTYLDGLGPLYISAGTPWMFMAWANTTSVVDVSVPTTIPTPVMLILQAVGIQQPDSTGNTSNPVEVTIE